MSFNKRIRAESLTKRYRSGNSELTVLDDLWLEVREGERLAVIGASGAGKSTLLHLLGGLDRPSSGRVYFGQQDITTFSEGALADFRNRELGYLWQNPSLLPEFSAVENVMMPLLIRGMSRDAAFGQARERLKEVGLEKREEHRAGELSGGEQQRIAMARALVANPLVLLADEPTGSLDQRTGGMIFDLLREIHRSRNLTSIFVTHNLRFASRCDEVLELKNGRLATPIEGDWEATGVSTDATRLDGGTYV